MVEKCLGREHATSLVISLARDGNALIKFPLEFLAACGKFQSAQLGKVRALLCCDIWHENACIIQKDFLWRVVEDHYVKPRQGSYEWGGRLGIAI